MASKIRGLPPITFRRLYQQPATALAIFRRMLPSLAKVFVTTLLYHEKPIPLTELESWVQRDSYKEREDAFGKLRRLHIMHETSGRVTLDNEFKKNFRLALTGGGEHNSFGVPMNSPDKKVVDVEFLDEYATKQFDTILDYMVQDKAVYEPSPGVKHLLEGSGLMERRGHNGSAITKNGFSFLLQEGNAQIWVLLIQYLEMSEQLGMEKTDVLHFLLMLGSLDLGQAYSVATLTKTQSIMLRDLRDYGIVYMRKLTSDRFYPTRLATTLTSDVSGLRSANEGLSAAMATNDNTGGAPGDKGFIIIETNYRVYAYTSSPLQIAVLNLFLHLKLRFQNLVSGVLTRKSIQSAISRGITADQIIDYLRVHAHPQMRKTILVLPPTVVDQIRLWQIEGERMKTTPGMLFREFSSTWDYEDTARYAEGLGVLRWKNDKKRMIFVTRHEQIADYLKRRATPGVAKKPAAPSAAS
ncbi:transcription factor Tfb2-domain-containing protein [Geopyxis carbonaria]|nr:transcription factor Tfb2-domain-containing protein [Geopyxis carbonaria]